MGFSFKTALISQLIDHQLVTHEQIEKLTQSSVNYPSLSFALIKLNLITSEQFIQFVQHVFDVEFFDLNTVNLSTIPNISNNKQLILKYFALPVLTEKHTLIIAVGDPTNLAALNDFEFHSDLLVRFVICDPIKLNSLIETILLNKSHRFIPASNKTDLNNAEPNLQQKEKTVQTTEAPIVSYINETLENAIKRNASDIHFEPYENNYRIRFRIDGVLTEIPQPSVELTHRISARIKAIANMDIAEKRHPQDGRLTLTIHSPQNKTVEFRISTLPTIWGEKVVMRLLQNKMTKLSLHSLGFEEQQKQTFIKALNQPQGLILVTGPTGSGKSLSLYAGLDLLNNHSLNISTVEDPVEIHLEGINQVQTNSKIGLGFAHVLRAFLRQDPDVLMIGEIRDTETAEIAIKSSQTGHLVLSTLHTKSAAETITRLVNMGIPPYNLASSISLIVAQRLVRRLCSSCKKVDTDFPNDEFIQSGFQQEQINDSTIYKAQSCDKCNQGYTGRTGIFEVVKPSNKFRQIIVHANNPLEIATQIDNEHTLTLKQSGLLKVLAGITSLAEINRVTVQS